MSIREVQTVSCVNDAGFVMHFSVAFTDDNGSQTETGDSGNYPIDQQRSIDLSTQGVSVGTIVWPHVRAILGRDDEGGKRVRYALNGETATYQVSGTTFNYGVNLL